MKASKSFEPDPGQVTEARRFVECCLEAAGLRSTDVALLVSELATNAVLHARSDFTVSIEIQAQRAHVEVFDRNTRLPTFSAVRADAHSGRGLMLLQALSEAWGVQSHSDSGKTIWFDLSVKP